MSEDIWFYVYKSLVGWMIDALLWAFFVFLGRLLAWRDELREESLSTVVTPIWSNQERALFCTVGPNISGALGQLCIE